MTTLRRGEGGRRERMTAGAEASFGAMGRLYGPPLHRTGMSPKSYRSHCVPNQTLASEPHDAKSSRRHCNLWPEPRWRAQSDSGHAARKWVRLEH